MQTTDLRIDFVVEIKRSRGVINSYVSSYCHTISILNKVADEIERDLLPHLHYTKC